MAPHWRILFDVSLEFKDCTFSVVSRYVSSMKLKRVWFLLLFLFVLRPSPLSSPPNRTPTSVCRSQTDAEESSALLLLIRHVWKGKKKPTRPLLVNPQCHFFCRPPPPPRCYFYKKKMCKVEWLANKTREKKKKKKPFWSILWTGPTQFIQTFLPYYLQSGVLIQANTTKSLKHLRDKSLFPGPHLPKAKK